ncbi:hypothetical protein K0U83_19715, partial [bacterium]|nr:hypothetical protein [bacterium]
MPLVSELPYEPWRERGSILAGEFRWRLGVRPLDLANWIELGPDADGPDGWIAQKAALLGQHASTVFGALDGIEPASQVVNVPVASDYTYDFYVTSTGELYPVPEVSLPLSYDTENRFTVTT